MWRLPAEPSRKPPCLRRNKRYGRSVPTRSAARPPGEWPSSENAIYESFAMALLREAVAPGPKSMSDISVRSTRSLKREVSNERGPALVHTLIHLWPFIWPSQRSDLKLRVWIAMAFLLFAKIATMAVPFTFKWATDALTGQGAAAP